VIVFFAASEHVWSLFVNFGSFGLMGLLFAPTMRFAVWCCRAGRAAA
jgi:hypothetical protein